MDNLKWNLKSNYILALTVCKYGLNSDCWKLVADDIAFYIKATPENCKIQFEFLCQEYGQDWQKQKSIEPIHNYIFSIIKRLYYGDLYERMTESRELLIVMYDFIRLFRCGKITSDDINTIIQDVKNIVPTDDNEQQQKIKMLERLKFHMTQQISQTSDIQPSTFPVELLPPPAPFFPQPILNNYISQDQSIINDRQVPSINIHQKLNGIEFSTFSNIIQTNNLLIENKKQINNNDIDEIELSSDEDDDRIATTTATHVSDIDEQVTSSNIIEDQDESTFISDEQIDTNQSSNIPPISNEISNSNERDSYENVSTTSNSNLSTQVTSSNNDQPISSNLQLNTSSSDFVTLDSDRLQSTQNHHHHHSAESESNVTTPRRISVIDDEVARMDAEQIPEPIPTDITDVAVPNDNAIFIIDELDSNKITTNISSTNDSHRESRLTNNSISINFRKSLHTILQNLKTAKYGPDFAKPLKSFKLPNEYYNRVKKPLDIPEIRERMNNGDYDENILLFERDILLMFTNALTMYHRNLDIHGHAQYMINYAIELLTPIEEIHTPWQNDLNENNNDLSNVFDIDNENNINHKTIKTRTSSIASTSSSIRTNESIHNLRRPRTSDHPIFKRQRKTTH